MSRPTLLDAFCGAGGASYGYWLAGFDVRGVDIRPQPRYPFPFFQDDALEYLREHGHEFDAIHASPPCQKYSAMTKGRWKEREHVDLVAETRRLLEATEKPWVIENVSGAPLRASFVLCGTMFGLQTKCGAQLRRHRLFESPACQFALLPPCQHNEYSAIGVYGGGQHPQRRKVPVIGIYGGHARDRRRINGERGGPDFSIAARQEAMGIDWMTGAELSQAIPPAYTAFIGARLMEALAP